MATPRKPAGRATPKTPEVKISPEELDPNNLTLEDLEEIEAITGEPLDPSLVSPPAKFMVATIYVQARKKNPDVTIEDVRRIKIANLPRGDVGPRPTKATGSRK